MNINEKQQKVLFQKLGNDWYAFVEGEEETLFAKLPPHIDPRNHTFDIIQILKDQQKEKDSKHNDQRSPKRLQLLPPKNV